MIGKGKLGSGVKILYRDENLDNPFPEVATSQPSVTILKESPYGYFVDVHSKLFNPTLVWISKNDVVEIKWNEQKKVEPVEGLQTGDVMVVTGRDGKKIGEWIFTKY